MNATKDPAVLFYTGDFLTGSCGLTMEERGQYITLLCLQHQQGPLTEKQVRLAVGMLSEDVRAKFVTDEEGRLYNERMALEMEKRASYISDQSKKGKKGAESRWHRHNIGNGTAIAQPMHRQWQCENENKNININNNLSNDRGTNSGEIPQIPSNDSKKDAEDGECTSMIEARFALFWQAYPKKKAKSDARKAWLKLRPSEELLKVILDAIAAQKKSTDWLKDGGQFIPYPSTWLNRGQWMDEIMVEAVSDPVQPKYSEFDAAGAFEAALKRSYEEEEQ